MPKYVANPVLVDAYKIIAVGNVDSNGDFFVTAENGAQFLVTKAMASRYFPERGDYFVIQKDDYRYINPAQVFERKYSPYDESEAA